MQLLLFVGDSYCRRGSFVTGAVFSAAHGRFSVCGAFHVTLEAPGKEGSVHLCCLALNRDGVAVPQTRSIPRAQHSRVDVAAIMAGKIK